MKSKNVNRLIAVGVGVLILIIFSGIIYFSLGKPKFQPYKQECGEGFFNQDFYNDCISLLMDYEDLMNMSMHNDFSRVCNLWAIRIGEIKSSCEKFEVDSMFFENVSEDMFLDCWQIHNDEKCLIDGRNRDIVLLKNGLSIAWLDIYCDAIEFSRCEDLSCKNQEIYKWQCGNYIIEVN